MGKNSLVGKQYLYFFIFFVTSKQCLGYVVIFLSNFSIVFSINFLHILSNLYSRKSKFDS